MRSAKPHIILIDGESGAGKTTLADVMAVALNATVVHLDDAYPGWDGLEAGRDSVIATVLRPLVAGEDGSFEAWDWEHNRPGGAVAVPHREVIIVEGCGSSTPESRQLADVSVWVDCPADVRLDRLRRRDGTAFDEFAEIWESQVARHIATNNPVESATVRLNG